MSTATPEKSETEKPQAGPETGKDGADDMRRRFLISCGKFAVVTPPTIALILAESDRNYAMALSGGSHGHHFGFGGGVGGGRWHRPRHFADNGFGNGGGDGVPGRSGFNASPNAGEKLADSRR